MRGGGAGGAVMVRRRMQTGGADIAWVGAPRAKDCRMNRVRNPDRVTPFPAHRLRQNKRTGGLSLNLLLLYSSFSEGKRYKASAIEF